MRFSLKKTVTAAVIGAVSLSSLSACVISDDPYVNTAATAATAVGVVSLLLYAVNDGYYYDQDYNRMPRNYRPPHNVEVVRVNDIHEYRRQNPRPAPQQHRGTYQKQPAPHHQEYNLPKRNQPQVQQPRRQAPDHVWRNDNPNRPVQKPQPRYY